MGLTTLDQAMREIALALEVTEIRYTETALIQDLTKVLRIASPTCYRWFAGNKKPVGEKHLRLLLFAEVWGYTLVERAKVTDTVRDLADIIALGVCPIRKAAEAMLITNYDNLFRWCLGKLGPNPDSMQTITLLVEAYAQALEKKKKEFVAEVAYIRETYAPRAKVSAGPGESKNGTRAATALTGLALVERLAALIKEATPLAAALESDAYTPELRKKLRELTAKGSSHDVFELSNLLTRLCGEKTRAGFHQPIRKE